MRSTFFDPEQEREVPAHRKRYRHGPLYSIEKFPNAQTQSLARKHMTPALRVSWLQNLATFWLLGFVGETISFRYQAKEWSLKPIDGANSKFRGRVRTFEPPFRAIASMNTNEQFLRLILSQRDLPKHTVFCEVPYDAEFPSGSSTRGFQHFIYSKLHSELNVRRVAMATRERSATGEKGKLTFLLAPIEPNEVIGETELLKINNAIVRAVTHAQQEMSLENGRSIDGAPRVAPLASRLLFFSTRFEWLEKDKKTLYDPITEAAKRFGFKLISGWPQKQDDYGVMLAGAEVMLAPSIVNLIKQSSVFLQLVPSSALKSNDSRALTWIVAELGIAMALGKPYAICIDSADGHTTGEWQTVLKIPAGTSGFFPFSNHGDDNSILECIEKAIKFLSMR